MSGGTGKPARRLPEPPAPAIDSFRDQHLELAERQIATERGRANVTVDESESPLAWPSRSAKVVLQLALDRLARHYGYAAQVRGPAYALIRTWLADGAEFSVDGD
jgi:hypothetical protein